MAEDEVPICHVPQRREYVAAQTSDLARQEHDGVRERDHEHQVERGKQPPRSPQPEGLYIDVPQPTPLREQQRRDEVAADDEEDLDAQEPSRDPGQPAVVEEHGDDGERSQPVETGHVW